MTDVRALRERLGWSQAQLSRFLGAHSRTAHRWEHGVAPSGAAAEFLQALEDMTQQPGGVLKVQEAAKQGLTMTALLRQALKIGRR